MTAISGVRKLAPAKINLSLAVTGQRADGYHQLDSLVAFTTLGDVVEVEPADVWSLTINGPFAESLPVSDDNLVLRAGHAMQDAFASYSATVSPADIRLTKNLPVASGIGGGSADAAAVMLALQDLWGQSLPSDDMHAIALSLGADIPACLAGVPSRMQGIGERLTPVAMLGLPVVLANCGRAIATPRIFAALPSRNNPQMDMPMPTERDPWMEWLRSQRNDLQQAAVALVPEIETTLDTLAAAGAQLARMSGSGATCFGVFESIGSADQAAERLKTKHPDWWIVTTELKGTPE